MPRAAPASVEGWCCSRARALTGLPSSRMVNSSRRRSRTTRPWLSTAAKAVLIADTSRKSLIDGSEGPRFEVAEVGAAVVPWRPCRAELPFPLSRALSPATKPGATSNEATPNTDPTTQRPFFMTPPGLDHELKE